MDEDLGKNIIFIEFDFGHPEYLILRGRQEVQYSVPGIACCQLLLWGQLLIESSAAGPYYPTFRPLHLELLATCPALADKHQHCK